MKARKTLSHKLLVEEVIPQLSPRFRPEKPKIKVCFVLLIVEEKRRFTIDLVLEMY